MSFTLDDMRVCAKIRCAAEAIATIGLSYEQRTVVVGPLVADPNPNLLDLCADHVARLTPPRGWLVRDERAGLAEPRAEQRVSA
jgi:hypothetical protein